MYPEFQVNVWAKITLFVLRHGNQRWKWWKPWSKYELHPRKCCWHPCPASWCGRGWGHIRPNLPELCWGLALGLALLCWDKAAVLITRTTPFLFSSQQIITFLRLKTSQQHIINWYGNGSIPHPERLPGYRGNGCHKNVMLDTSTR